MNQEMNNKNLYTINQLKKLLFKGKTVKCDLTDAIELIESDEKLNLINSQNQRKIIDDLNRVHNEIHNTKIIMKYITKFNTNEKLLYWSFCDFEDILLLGGADKFDSNTNKYIDKKFIKAEDQFSFLGKDIKIAAKGVDDEFANTLEREFINSYINEGKYPLSDNVFYTIFVRELKEYGTQQIVSKRNTILSPRKESK